MKIAVCGAAGKTGKAVADYLENNWEVLRVDPKLETFLEEVIEEVVCVVDFTTPEAVVENLKICLEHGKNMVIGTTGWDLNILNKIQLKPNQAIFVAPNFSIGANLMMYFSKVAARFFKDWHIVEAHHKAKKDKPSGTAKFTSKLIAGDVVNEKISSIRSDGLIAHQSVIFSHEGEVLEITHHSLSRSSFAYGVELAIKWCLENSGVEIGLHKLLGLDM